MVRRAALLTLAVLAGCREREAPAPAPQPTVAAAQHDAFFLWPGVRPPPGVAPRLLYLLDGEVRRGGRPELVRLRPGVPRLPGMELWLVVRTDRLDWGTATERAILADLARWRAAGNRVAGLQVDFDAATKGIGGYRAFLQGLRARLPGDVKLSITGLMDWSAHGDPVELGRLAGVVDEVVVQTYQGRETIPGYAAYFARMGGFPLPFRVALAEGGKWAPPPGLERHPRFRGYVVFLVRPK